MGRIKANVKIELDEVFDDITVEVSFIRDLVVQKMEEFGYDLSDVRDELEKLEEALA